MESNVLHRSVSYWESSSCKFFLYSLCTQKWIEPQLWKGNFNLMISKTSATRNSPPIKLWRRMFRLWQMKITNDVYFQSCQLMFRSRYCHCDCWVESISWSFTNGKYRYHPNIKSPSQIPYISSVPYRIKYLAVVKLFTWYCVFHPQTETSKVSDLFPVVL